MGPPNLFAEPEEELRRNRRHRKTLKLETNSGPKPSIDQPSGKGKASQLQPDTGRPDSSASATSNAHGTHKTSALHDIQVNVKWLAANHAMDLVRDVEFKVEALLRSHGIGSNDYALGAGFDRSIIVDGTGYMQQIHLFTTVEVSRVRPLFSELGQLFRPFPSMVFTPSAQLRLPVTKEDGTEWPFDEFVAHYFYDPGGPTVMLGTNGTGMNIEQLSSKILKDGGAPGWSYPKRPRKGKDDGNRDRKREKARGDGEDQYDDPLGGGNGGDDEGEGSDPEGDPREPVNDSDGSPPRITFHVESKIHCNSVQPVQTINCSGSLSVQMTKQTAEFRKYDIDFTGLTQSSEHTPKAVSFEQDYMQIIVDSRRDNGQLEYTRPLRTVGPAEIKKTNSSKTTANFNASLNLSAHPYGTLGVSRSSEKGQSDERMESISRIHHGKRLGLLWWGYSLNDQFVRNSGVEMLEGSAHLPFVKLQYRFPGPNPPASEVVGENSSSASGKRKISRDAPIDVEFASFWTLVPNSMSPSSSSMSSESSPSSSYFFLSRIKEIIRSSKENGPTYSNMVQCIILTIPPVIRKDSDYIAEVKVKNIVRVAQGRKPGSAPEVKDTGAAVAEISKRVVQQLGEVECRTSTIPTINEHEAKEYVDHNRLRPTELNMEDPDATSSRRELPSETPLQIEVSAPPGRRDKFLAWLQNKRLRKRPFPKMSDE
ncbi:hypothetical protein CPC08DRAFT_166264 [Agrocybe pediades]|nr:hypothetical protein CPC08DRAFT_166264 [Agrocybe pediades]